MDRACVGVEVVSRYTRAGNVVLMVAEPSEDDESKKLVYLARSRFDVSLERVALTDRKQTKLGKKVNHSNYEFTQSSRVAKLLSYPRCRRR